MRALVLVVVLGCGGAKDQPSASTSETRGSPCMMVDELAARDPAQLRGELRVRGRVVPYSIVEGDDLHVFRLEREGKSFSVVIRGRAPDILRDDAELVATGRLVRAPDGIYSLEATELTAKCPAT